ncbi:MAG TPA: hypothetical protein DCE71_00615 [Parachlamydiales bacterium]|nr:hypothetical protein [Parachlamydiales bacterium]
MALNLNNSLSVPRTAVIQVPGFTNEEDVCPICHSNELENAKGKPHTFISHEGQEGHVVHAKCLRVFIKQMLSQMGGVLPFGFIKCLHCQVALDPTGVNNEVFKTKIPKGLFARTLKLASKAPKIAQQIGIAYLNSDLKEFHKQIAIPWGAALISGLYAHKFATFICNEIMADNSKVKFTEIGLVGELLLVHLIGLQIIQLMCKSAGISTTTFGNPSTISTVNCTQLLIGFLLMSLINQYIHKV